MITTWPSGNLSFTVRPTLMPTEFTTQFERDRQRVRESQQTGTDRRRWRNQEEIKRSKRNGTGQLEGISRNNKGRHIT